MILDSLLKVCAAQQVTADAASGNTIDFGNVTPKRIVADGEPMGYLIAVTAIGTNSGSAKLLAIESAAANLGTPQTVGQLDIAAGDILAGAIFVVALSKGIPALRYGGLYFDITGTVDFTVDAYFGPLSMLSRKTTQYAKGFTVS